MAEVGQGTKSGAIPPHSDIQVLQTHEQQSFTTPVPSYTQEFARAALSPTALGELASTVSLNAGLQIAKMQGQKYGKNPEGELLPPITAADKAFVDAYSAQAEATLGNQAQQLMFQAQEEANKSYMLTPGVIQTYHENVAKGLDGILMHAPSTIRGEMENQFASQLNQSSYRMNMSMISQNKERAQQEASVYNAHQLQQMHDAALSGNTELASQIYESVQKSTRANAASGMLSPTQADAQLTSAKLNYYSSIEIQKALDARNNHQLEGFLSGMVNTKPSSLNWSEWEDVRNKTVAYVGAVENLDNRDQSLILSQATARAAMGPLSSDYIEQLRSQLMPARFNNFMSSYISKQHAQYKQRQAVADIQSNWTNPLVMGSAKAETVNQAFTGMVEATKQQASQKGIQLSDDDAQLEAAASAGAPVPMYINKLNKGLQSGNPQLMLRDWQDYQALKRQNGNLVQGVKKESIAMGTMFNHFLEEGKPTDVAAQMAQDVVMNKTKEVQENNERLIGDWRKSTIKDGTTRRDWANKLAGISKGTYMANSAGFALHVQNLMEDNMRYTNGNVEAAEQMVKEAMSQYWGYTNVNGQREFSYMPVEKAINKDSGATPLIRQDMVNQLQANFEQGKAAYDNGNMPYYMRFKNPHDFEAYLRAKDEIRKKQTIAEYGKALFSGKPADLQKQFKIVSEFEDTKPIEVEMVNRSGEVRTYKLSIQPSPLMQQSPGGIIGDYDVTMSDDRGVNYPIPGPRIGPVTHSVYRPNAKWIDDHYFAVNGVDPNNATEKQLALERFLRKPKEQEAFLRSIQ